MTCFHDWCNRATVGFEHFCRTCSHDNYLAREKARYERKKIEDREYLDRKNEAKRQKYQTDPEYRKAQLDRFRKAISDPAIRERKRHRDRVYGKIVRLRNKLEATTDPAARAEIETRLAELESQR